MGGMRPGFGLPNWVSAGTRVRTSPIMRKLRSSSLAQAAAPTAAFFLTLGVVSGYSYRLRTHLDFPKFREARLDLEPIRFDASWKRIKVH